MKKQSLLEYIKDNLEYIQEWWKSLWLFLLLAVIWFLFSAALTLAFLFILCLFMSNLTIVSLLGSAFFLVVLVSTAPIVLMVFDYFDVW